MLKNSPEHVSRYLSRCQSSDWLGEQNPHRAVHVQSYCAGNWNAQLKLCLMFEPILFSQALITQNSPSGIWWMKRKWQSIIWVLASSGGGSSVTQWKRSVRTVSRKRAGWLVVGAWATRGNKSSTRLKMVTNCNTLLKKHQRWIRCLLQGVTGITILRFILQTWFLNLQVYGFKMWS